MPNGVTEVHQCSAFSGIGTIQNKHLHQQTAEVRNRLVRGENPIRWLSPPVGLRPPSGEGRRRRPPANDSHPDCRPAFTPEHLPPEKLNILGKDE